MYLNKKNKNTYQCSYLNDFTFAYSISSKKSIKKCIKKRNVMQISIKLFIVPD